MKWPIGVPPARLLVPVLLGVLALAELFGVPLEPLDAVRRLIEGIPFVS